MKENKPVIVFLGGMNLTPQNVYRTGVEFLEKQFEVVVLDCRPLLQRPIDPSIVIDPRFRRIYQLTTLDDLVRILENLNPIYAIDFIGPCQEMKLIQPALRNAGCKFVIQKLGQLPQPNLVQRRINQFSKLLKQIFGHRINEGTFRVDIRIASIENRDQTSNISKVSKIINDYLETSYFEKADIALAAGRRAIKSCSKLANTTLSVKSMDAHQFAQATKTYRRDQLGSLPNSYAVFIDDALVHATDWALLRQEPPVEPKEYFEQLNYFFSQIEKLHDLKVVIAGHPQVSHNSDYISSFAGRHVYFGNTPNLVIGCVFAIVHGSTAASFAVMSEKPIMVVSNLMLDKSSYGKIIRNLAKALGVTVTLMEHLDSSTTFPQLPSKAYTKYRRNLLYDESCAEQQPWGEFFSFVNGVRS